MQTRKKVFIISAIINIIFAVFYIYIAYVLLKNTDGIADALYEMLKEMYGGDEGLKYLNMVTFYATISAIASIIFSVVLFIFANFTNSKFNKYRNLFIFAFIVNTIFGINFITFVLICVGLFAAESEPVKKNPFANKTYFTSTENLLETIRLKNMTDKIEYIKSLRQSGNIGEEEYYKLLNEIITNGVK